MQSDASLGINVILDFGFWSRSERDSLRILAHKVGARVEVHFLDVPMAELLKRMHDERATEPAFTLNFTEEDLKLWASCFKPPDPDKFNIIIHRINFKELLFRAKSSKSSK